MLRLKTMIGCIIQARMSSTRLPEKVLKKLDDTTTSLGFSINQIKASKLLERIVIATSNNKEDDKIVNFAKENNIEFFRGSLDDVLDRHYKCAKKFSFTTIVRIPSDKPLIDPQIIDNTIEFFNSNSYDYVANYDIVKPYTQGTEVEVFSFESIKKAWKMASNPSEKEHVTPYLYKNPEQFKIFRIVEKDTTRPLKWALDTEEDLFLIRKIISKIQKRPILKKNILELYEREPVLFDINKNVIYNEGDLRSIKEDKEIDSKNSGILK